MTFGPCNREREVTDLLHRGHWPQACPAELRAHVDTCRSCSDLVLVSQAFQQARSQSVAQPRLESPGALWWRAQLRRRNSAIERVARPIFGAQIFALAVSLVFAAGLLAWQVRRGFNAIAWIQDLPRALHLDALLPAAMPKFDGSLLLLAPILATLALLGGFAIYIASEKN
jgi:hypothetical protein